MSYLVINGGKKLTGAIANQSNKNSALSIMCAAVLVGQPVTLVDMPKIEEVERLAQVLKNMGVRLEWRGKNILFIDASGSLKTDLIETTAGEMPRAALLLWGALAVRKRKYRLRKSGGCRLGERTVRPHLYALEKLGVRVRSHEHFYDVENLSLRAARIVMYESGDVATENAILAAVLAPGITTISMASANYMVQDLCHFLNRAGAKITGIGTTTLEITGVHKLQAVASYPIMPDPIVAMTYLSAAITTHSELTIENCPLDFLELELCKLEVMGQKIRIHNRRLSKNKHFAIGDITVCPSRLVALPDKIYGRPFPGLNIDNLPLFVPILTQAKGRTLVHDWAYENRAVYSLELQKLGAEITLLDPHRLWVEGPTKLLPNEVICPPALRPAVNVLICMLAAKGRSILRNAAVIERGYENLYHTLNSVGAQIIITEDN